MDSIFATCMYSHSLLVGLKRMLISGKSLLPHANPCAGLGKEKVSKMIQNLREDDTIQVQPAE